MKITKQMIKEVKEFAYSESEQYQLPPVYYLGLSMQKGQWLAEEFEADKGVVMLGTLLMDCQLGVAAKKGVNEKHVNMSAKKADDLLTMAQLDDDLKDNVLACVREHHGVDKFSSIESEICCNADCYRFASIEGFLGGLRYTRDMSFEDLIGLLSRKADEKWNALSLDICKKELRPQYKLIREMINKLE
jgi:hypothetical protein